MRNQAVFVLVMIMAVFGFYVCEAEAIDITFTEDGVIQEGDVYGNVYILNDATVDMTGGTVRDIWLRDQSTLDFSGGAVRVIWARDSSTVNITGGSLHLDCLSAEDSSLVNIYDVEMMDIGKFAMGYLSVMNIYGGKISADNMHISGKVNIFGGNITFGYASFREDNLFIYGYDFNYDPNLLVFTGSLLYGGQITIDNIWSDQYELLNLFVTERWLRNIARTIVEKNEMLEAIDQMLDKEQEACEDLEELLESGDYGDLSKADIIRTRQRIHSAMQHQEQSKKALEKSIAKLEDAVAALGWDILVDGPVQE